MTRKQLNPALEILNEHNFFLSDKARSYTKGEDYENTNTPRVVIVFGEAQLKHLFVIVEMYDKKQYGRVKREYLKQFNEKERKLMSQWYARIYAWYLRIGIPHDGVTMSINTYETLCRFADFFASI